VRVTGVDGCRGGWLAATVDDADTVVWEWTTEVAQLLRAGADAVAIDIPIGLPDTGRRTCDQAARSLLGRRGATVFAAPVRPVLDCVTYADARGVLATLGGPSMSAQAFGIVAAVRAVDAVVTVADETRVVEAHPEVAFTLMGGGHVCPGKRTTAGVGVRLRLLQSWLPTVLDALADVPGRAGLDDALDALACAWVARRWVRGEATVLGDGERDRRGLLMRIVA
jgi:predicted RNase H-like nuclease